MNIFKNIVAAFVVVTLIGSPISIFAEEGASEALAICNLEIVSDTSTLLSDNSNAVATYSANPRWTASIPGATWIWKTVLVENPTIDEETSFSRTFNIVGTPTVASLIVAADNGYEISVNGNPFAQDNSELNYFDEEKDSYDLSSVLTTGSNNISFKVKNFGWDGATPQSNPAGLLFKLNVQSEAVTCNTNPGGGPEVPVNNPPVLTLLGANPFTVIAGNTFTDPGATANDTEDGNLTSSITVSGSVNTSLPGNYVLSYSVTDSDGASASANRTVVVEPATTFRVIATKIVCNNEIDLPNWGVGGPDVTASTASDFLASHPSCHLQPGWEFEWGYQSVTDPGSSFVGPAGSGWTTFGLTDSQGKTQVDIPAALGSDKVWIREVLKNGYIPFYGPYANNDAQTNVVSAELFCNQDVLYFDNYDYVLNPQNGNTYYCIALNVANSVNPPVNTPPIITLIGANPLNLTIGDTFTDPGATANDTEDGNLTDEIATTTTVNTAVAGTYEVTYSVTDSGNLSTSVTRSVIVSPVSTPPTNPPTDNAGGNGGGGGGGGGGLGGHRRDITTIGGGAVLGATTCSYLRDYLRKDLQNDPLEVLKLQSFLNAFEGENLSFTANFDDATFDAVSRFQNKYSDDILAPWGHTAPTGYVYILTKKKINEIFCKTIYPLSASDQSEIDSFRSFIQDIEENGGVIPDVSGSIGVGTSTESENPTDSDFINGSEIAGTNVLRNAAISLFSIPESLSDTLECAIVFLIVLAVIYILASLFSGGPARDEMERMKIRRKKLIWSAIFLIVAIALSAIFAHYCTILPFVIVFLIVMGVILFGNGTAHKEAIKNNSYDASLEKISTLVVEEPSSLTDKVTEEGEKKGFKGIIGE